MTVYVELWMIGWIVGTTKHAKVSVGWVRAIESEERSAAIQRLNGTMIKEICGSV